MQLVTDGTGSMVATVTMSATVRLDEAGDALTGRYSVSSVGPDGQPLPDSSGTMQGTRIKIALIADFSWLTRDAGTLDVAFEDKVHRGSHRPGPGTSATAAPGAARIRSIRMPLPATTTGSRRPWRKVCVGVLPSAGLAIAEVPGPTRRLTGIEVSEKRVRSSTLPASYEP